MFSQYAQQMGMQNVRAILPEQIDLLLNTSIMDIVNQTIKENIGVTNDRVITDNSKIGQINALRTLYKVREIEMSPAANPISESRAFAFSASDRNTGRMTTNFPKLVEPNIIPNYMFLVDFSLNYKKVIGNLGYNGKNIVNSYVAPTFDEDGLETNYFPVRIIDDTYLADTLNDFILKNRLRSPIIVTYNSNTFDLYIDKFKKVTLENGDIRYVLENNLIPYKLRMSYIAKPAKVRYSEDLDGENVDCDLPDYQHVDVVKHAVDLFRIAISGSLYAAQQQERAGQQENMRNNYRNEGTQRQ